jgi:hypothetical protein
MCLCALLLTVLAGSCDDTTYYPGALLQGKQVGVWRLDDRNGSGGPIPDPFKRLELRSTSDEPLSDGILIDGDGRSRTYRMATNAESFFGPWLIFKDSETGVGWNDKIYLGCVAQIDDPENFNLLIAFERDPGGSLYPHTYKRVR